MYEAQHYPKRLGGSNFTGSELIKRRLQNVTKGLKNYKPGPLSSQTGKKLKIKDMRKSKSRRKAPKSNNGSKLRVRGDASNYSKSTKHRMKKEKDTVDALMYDLDIESDSESSRCT